MTTCCIRNSIPLLAMAALLVACMFPGVRQESKLRSDQTELARLVNEEILTTSSREYLIAADLYETYQVQPTSVIVELRSRYEANGTPANLSVLIELSIDVATRLQASAPRQAAGYYLAAAELAYQANAAEPGLTLGQTNRLAAYNHATGQVARLLFDLGEFKHQPVTVKGPWHNYTLHLQSEGRGLIDPRAFSSLIPAEYLSLTQTSVERVVTKGYGAAMVGHREATPALRADNRYLPAFGLSMAINALLDFRAPHQVTLALHDLGQVDVGQLGSRTVPLAADRTAALVQIYNHVGDPDIAWKGMRQPDKYLEQIQLVQFEPFNPDKIPVIFVHGLISSPKIWLPTLNRLNSDPLLRRHYQLFAFVYPSGFPVIYNAAALRRRLVEFQQYFDPEHDNEQLRNVLMVGHSMGGVLSSFQIRTSGRSLSRALFTRPIENLSGIDDAQKAALRELLIYAPAPDVTRAVFLATPHIGSDAASGLRGVIGSKLIDFPVELLVAKPVGPIDGLTEYGRSLTGSRPDGISSLTPRNPLLVALEQQQIPPEVTYHSIIGQKNSAQPLTESSDGTVAYWSSHLTGASSEKIIQDKHTPMVKNPATIEELRRIMYLHAKLPYSPPAP